MYIIVTARSHLVLLLTHSNSIEPHKFQKRYYPQCQTLQKSAKQAVCQEFLLSRILLVSKTTIVLLDTLDAYIWSTKVFSCFVPINLFEFQSKGNGLSDLS